MEVFDWMISAQLVREMRIQKNKYPLQCIRQFR